MSSIGSGLPRRLHHQMPSLANPMTLPRHHKRDKATMKSDTEMRAQRSQAGLPGGAARLCAFPSELRAQLVTRDGKSFFEVTGYASVFNRGYEMWDIFGSYNETVDSAAFNDTLSRNPDVAFLVNHRGVTMRVIECSAINGF